MVEEECGDRFRVAVVAVLTMLAKGDGGAISVGLVSGRKGVELADETVAVTTAKIEVLGL